MKCFLVLRIKHPAEIAKLLPIFTSNLLLHSSGSKHFGMHGGLWTFDYCAVRRIFYVTLNMGCCENLKS